MPSTRVLAGGGGEYGDAASVWMQYGQIHFHTWMIVIRVIENSHWKVNLINIDENYTYYRIAGHCKRYTERLLSLSAFHILLRKMDLYRALNVGKLASIADKQTL